MLGSGGLWNAVFTPANPTLAAIPGASVNPQHPGIGWWG